MYFRFVTLAIATVFAAGCASAERITMPLDTPGAYKPMAVLKDCNQSFAVQFHPNFKPGSFMATVDGASWTHLFTPTPAPGGTSTAKAPSAYEGGPEHTLSIKGALLPGTNGYTVSEQRSSVVFTVPRIHFSPTGVTLPRNGSASVFACLQPGPPSPIPVTLTPEGHSPVSLNGNTHGVPITLTFPVVSTTQACVPLSVTASTVPGSFLIRAASVGCQKGAFSGFVQ